MKEHTTYLLFLKECDNHAERLQRLFLEQGQWNINSDYVKLKTSETKGIFRVANKGKEDHFPC